MELLFEAWSSDPVELERQKALVGIRQRSVKLRKPKEKKKYKPPSEPHGEDFWEREPWEQRFYDGLSAYPRCAVNYEHGVYRKQKAIAVNYPHIQFNSAFKKTWLGFDYDHTGGATAHERAEVAIPNLVMVNPENGHSHLAYELAKPVTYYEKSRQASIAYLASIQRAMTRRLDSDKSFSGELFKNPLFEGWTTLRLRQAPYTLGELSGFLKPKEMRKWDKGEKQAGLGRNCTLFDEVRLIAYKDVLKFKAENKDVLAFRKHISSIADDLNHMLNFYEPLPSGEVIHIAKSIARWVWKHFTLEAFSDIQTNRIEKRWEGHVTAEEKAKALGVSRRTYYNMLRDGRINDNVYQEENYNITLGENRCSSVERAEEKRPTASFYYLDMVSCK